MEIPALGHHGAARGAAGDGASLLFSRQRDDSARLEQIDIAPDESMRIGALQSHQHLIKGDALGRDGGNQAISRIATADGDGLAVTRSGGGPGRAVGFGRAGRCHLLSHSRLGPSIF